MRRNDGRRHENAANHNTDAKIQDITSGYAAFLLRQQRSTNPVHESPLIREAFSSRPTLPFDDLPAESDWRYPTHEPFSSTPRPTANNSSADARLRIRDRIKLDSELEPFRPERGRIYTEPTPTDLNPIVDNFRKPTDIFKFSKRIFKECLGLVLVGAGLTAAHKYGVSGFEGEAFKGSAIACATAVGFAIFKGMSVLMNSGIHNLKEKSLIFDGVKRYAFLKFTDYALPILVSGSPLLIFNLTNDRSSRLNGTLTSLMIGLATDFVINNFLIKKSTSVDRDYDIQQRQKKSGYNDPYMQDRSELHDHIKSYGSKFLTDIKERAVSSTAVLGIMSFIGSVGVVALKTNIDPFSFAASMGTTAIALFLYKIRSADKENRLSDDGTVNVCGSKAGQLVCKYGVPLIGMGITAAASLYSLTHFLKYGTDEPHDIFKSIGVNVLIAFGSSLVTMVADSLNERKLLKGSLFTQHLVDDDRNQHDRGRGQLNRNHSEYDHNGPNNSINKLDVAAAGSIPTLAWGLYQTFFNAQQMGSTTRYTAITCVITGAFGLFTWLMQPKDETQV